MSGFLFGTVGSPISTPAKPGGSVGAIQTISSLGLTALELGWVQAVRVTEQTCALIKQESEKLQIAIMVISDAYPQDTTKISYSPFHLLDILFR